MSLRVCIDASLASRWVIPTEQDPLADSLLQEWDDDGTELLVPPLFDPEVTSAIRKNVYSKKILPRQGEEAYALYRELEVTFISDHLSDLAWLLAAEYDQVRTYDMQYLAVAELEDCELWTADRRLVNAVRGKTKRVKWLGEYQKQA
jgi:predicted nucleic acid-binding protein